MAILERITFATARVSALALLLFLSGCRPANQVNPDLSASMPNKIVWAWIRPEDLRFLPPGEFGVAFLAQTIFLENSDTNPKPRRQPLDVSPGTYMIAVTRIETNKVGGKRPSLSPEMVNKVVTLVKTTLDLPDVRAIQIDFDAVVSEREFYRSMMSELRKQTPDGVTFTMTALASWCTGDSWFNDFPVDEAVPMIFRMGADEEKIKTYLSNGNDWQEPLCRGSYGVSIDDPLPRGLKPGRRTYYFKNSSWGPPDLDKIR